MVNNINTCTCTSHAHIYFSLKSLLKPSVFHTKHSVITQAKADNQSITPKLMTSTLAQKHL